MRAVVLYELNGEIHIGLAALALDADVQTACLCIAQVGAGADLEVLLLADVYKRQAPGTRLILPAVPAEQAAALTHALAEEIR